MTTRSLVVPLDGSAHALVALPVAKRLAQLNGGTIHLVHVAQDATRPRDALERIGVSSLDLRGSILSTKTGDPARGILATAREVNAELVVMCTHTAASYAGEPALGATALAVLEGTACPVVLVRPERDVVPWRLTRVLLPHDGTPTTSAAIRPAVALARAAGAGLDVLHVAAACTPSPTERGSLAPPRYVDQPQHEWPAWLGEFVERLGSMCPLQSLDVRMWLARGVPGQEVLRVAAERADDLIVLAWRGEWGGEHAATVKTVLQRARSPVIVIRASE